MLEHARAEDWLPTVADKSVQLLLLDPPYHRVAAEEWDRQWKTPAAYLAWLASLADEWRRVLADNGSLYVFASAEMAARVEVEVIAPRFEVLNSITWAKGHADLSPGDPRLTPYKAVDTASARAFNSESERIIFAEQRGADSMALGESGYAAQCEDLRGHVFEPLRAYLEGEREAAGITRDQINEACGFACGGMAGHYFSRSQWQLPTAEHYATMRTLFNGHLRREYEELRRPFSVSADVSHTDVWEYATVEPGPHRHSCEKPVDMLRDIIRASSRPGDLVVDTFAGSGSAWAAAIDTGREFAGCESDLSWVRLARDRAERHLSIRERRPVATKRPAGSITGPLFDAT